MNTQQSPTLHNAKLAAINVLAVAGSLRRDSFNRRVPTVMSALALPDMSINLRTAGELFDAEGNLIEPRARESLATFAASFDHWVRALRPPVHSDAA